MEGEWGVEVGEGSRAELRSAPGGPRGGEGRSRRKRMGWLIGKGSGADGAGGDGGRVFGFDRVVEHR